MSSIHYHTVSAQLLAVPIWRLFLSGALVTWEHAFQPAPPHPPPQFPTVPETPMSFLPQSRLPPPPHPPAQNPSRNHQPPEEQRLNSFPTAFPLPLCTAHVIYSVRKQNVIQGVTLRPPCNFWTTLLTSCRACVDGKAAQCPNAAISQLHVLTSIPCCYFRLRFPPLIKRVIKKKLSLGIKSKQYPCQAQLKQLILAVRDASLNELDAHINESDKPLFP